jgi:hypothetical protein
MTFSRWCVVASALALTVGCAAEAESGSVPDVDVETLETAASITSVNANGTWVANATAPMQVGIGSVRAKATFTGPAGFTRAMGVCLLKMTTTACNSVADCASSPASLPSGGFRYCTAPNNGAQKYCAFRPGSQATYCGGTPALPPVGGLPQKVAPGTYQTATAGVSPAVDYVSYACFEGCTATDPSVSSTEFASCYANAPPGSNFYYCVDVRCDGYSDYCVGPNGPVRPTHGG